jgi:hypothetical protein
MLTANCLGKPPAAGWFLITGVGTNSTSKYGMHEWPRLIHPFVNTHSPVQNKNEGRHGLQSVAALG